MVWSIDHLVRAVFRSRTAGVLARTAFSWLLSLDRLASDRSPSTTLRRAISLAVAPSASSRTRRSATTTAALSGYPCRARWGTSVKDDNDGASAISFACSARSGRSYAPASPYASSSPAGSRRAATPCTRHARNCSSPAASPSPTSTRPTRGTPCTAAGELVRAPRLEPGRRTGGHRPAAGWRTLRRHPATARGLGPGRHRSDRRDGQRPLRAARQAPGGRGGSRAASLRRRTRANPG